MLTVVINKPKPELKKKLEYELRLIDHVLLTCPKWEQAIAVSNSDYICFIEDGADISDGYFRNNLNLFNSRPLFRKMAMIASTVDTGDFLIYGYFFNQRTMFPSQIRSSSMPYAVQAGYLPGAIIRLRVIKEVDYQWLDKPMMDSANISLAFWRMGNMCYLNPNTVYKTSADKVSIARNYRGEIGSELVELFQREVIK